MLGIVLLFGCGDAEQPNVKPQAEIPKKEDVFLLIRAPKNSKGR